ncbi:MAG: UbiA family prenyltransferase [Planctomycetes bacterium]|nr:UbiA family prenyltransferase [Planctomycetota bacterium]MCL4730784.1 UbiA family prenyltransferase [Planctomycetota bacterium]
MSATFLPSDDVAARLRARVSLGLYVRLAGGAALLSPAACAFSLTLCGAAARGAGTGPWRAALLAALAALLIAAATGALRQITDLDMDRINDPSLPLCTAEITPRRAGLFALASAVLATLTVAALCLGSKSWFPLPLFALFALARASRSIPGLHVRARSWPLSALVAALAGAALALGAWLVTGPFDFRHAGVLALGAALVMVAASALRDMAALRGEAAYGVGTRPAQRGAVSAAPLIAGLMATPFLVMPLGVVAGWVVLPPGQWYDALVVGAAGLLSACALGVRLLEDPESRAPRLRGHYALLVTLHFLVQAAVHVPHARWGQWLGLT